MATLKGANTTAQWYYDNYPGAYFSSLEKFVIHTTETRDWPGYAGGASAPNATYKPTAREIRQHHPNNRSSRALRDPSHTTVRENRDDVFQLEVICYSDYSLARRVGGLWVGDLTNSHYEDIARMILQLHEEERLSLNSSVQWKEGQTTYVSGVRLSGSAFDRYQGILGHVHVSGNTHWDPGGFRYSKLAAAIKRLSKPKEEVIEVQITPQELEALIKRATDAALANDILRLKQIIANLNDDHEAMAAFMATATQLSREVHRIKQILDMHAQRLEIMHGGPFEGVVDPRDRDQPEEK